MSDYDKLVEKAQIRKDAMDLSYKKLAERSGYSRSVVHRFLNGGNVGGRIAFDVCKALGLEIQVI